jgi:putative PIN family toxin of toxin-antitoxin system
VPAERPRLVLDTNVFVSGLLGGSTTSALLDAWLDHRVEIVTSRKLLEELAEVISRPRFRSLILSSERDRLLELICQHALIVEPTSETPLCRDPKDYPVMAAAIAGRAEFLVTGDLDLLDDPQLRTEMSALGTQVVGVRQLLELLDSA